MRRSAARIGIAALAAVIVLFSSAAIAFSLRVGPFHISFPSRWHRHHHHHHLIARSRPAGPVHPESGRGTASALFYPQLGLPIIFENIFSSPSSWPFDYQTMILMAFTKPEPQNTQSCEPQPDLAGRFLAPVGAVIELTQPQVQLLETLGDSLGKASRFLVESCPPEVPSTPTARLQLMDKQIGELAAALDGVRQPLQDFQHALTDEQLARFAAMIAASTANSADRRPANLIPGCGGDATSATDRAIDLIGRAVSPTTAQREALDALEAAFGKAASDLEADCSAPLPPTEFGRLEMVETRLDTARRALRSIQAGLTNFAAALSNEQRVRLDAVSFTAR